jgi:hypothetical protein
MKIKKLLLLSSLGFMLVMNVLAELLPFNNISTAAVSDSFKVFFVPAGYVFAIWGVIYLTQIWFSYSLIRNSRQHEQLLNRLLPWVVAGNIANGLWLVAWHYLQIYLTLPLMLVLLVSLCAQFLLIYSSQKRERAYTIPTGIYLGWITVATVANVTDVLYSLDWGGFGISGQVWAAVLILVAATLGVVMLIRHKQIPYAAVIAWAVIGIAVKFSDEMLIVAATGVAVVALIIAALVALRRR